MKTEVEIVGPSTQNSASSHAYKHSRHSFFNPPMKYIDNDEIEQAPDSEDHRPYGRHNDHSDSFRISDQNSVKSEQ